jgi:hypothetical protein
MEEQVRLREMREEYLRGYESVCGADESSAHNLLRAARLHPGKNIWQQVFIAGLIDGCNVLLGIDSHSDILTALVNASNASNN